MRFLKGVGILLGLLLVAGLAFEQWGEWRDARRFPPPGSLISVGDHRLHLRCVGQGQPTVLLLSGDSTPSVTLYEVQDRIAAYAQVCSYDRAGLGWSDPATKPMGLVDQVDDLASLLQAADIRGPFILVPESGGSLIALSYFARAPGKVAGMVLVDGSEPDLWFRGSPDEFPSMRMMDPVWQAAWRLGIIRAALPFAVPDWVATLRPTTKGQFYAVWSKPMPGYTRDTIDRWERTAVADRPTVIPGAWGTRPILLLRHGKAGGMGIPAQYEGEWPAAQARLATLSTNSKTIVAGANHHPIAEENPALVDAQVKALTMEIRRPISDTGHP
jgi:pimeloyl-ACP methyl ester carboxylesterase